MCTCRLCAGKLENAVFEINSCKSGIIRTKFEKCIPDINCDLTKNPMVCTSCLNYIENIYQFKNKCIANENKISKRRMNGVKLDLVNFVEGDIRNSDAEVSICRLCFKLIPEEDVIYVDDNQLQFKEGFVEDIVGTYAPEVDLSASEKPLICTLCFDILQTYSAFHKMCLYIEEKLVQSPEHNAENNEENTNLNKPEAPICETKSVEKPPPIDKKKLNQEPFAESSLIHTNNVNSNNMNKRKSNSLHVTPEISLLSEDEDSSNIEVDTKKRKLKSPTEKMKTKLSNILNNIKTEAKTVSELIVNKKKEIQLVTAEENILIGSDTEINIISDDESDLAISETVENQIKIKENVCPSVPNQRIASVIENEKPEEDIVEIDDSEEESCTEFSYEGSDDEFDSDSGYRTNSTSTKLKWTPERTAKKKKYHITVYQDKKGSKIYKCKICNFTALWKIANSLHDCKEEQRKNCDNDILTCDKCSFSTYRRDHLVKHCPSHRLLQYCGYKCTFCKFETNNKFSFAKHRQMKHNEEAPEEKPILKCDHCAFTAELKAVMSHHKLRHKKIDTKKKYKCLHCSFSSNWHESFSRHVAKHKDKNFKIHNCTSCNYSTTSNKCFDQHKILHQKHIEKDG